MTLKRRLIVAGLAAGFAGAVLVTAKRSSVSLISYIVEEALVQKLPAGTDPEVVRREYRSMVAALPEGHLKLEKLLSMSQFLEKLQTIERRDLEQLLAAKPARFPSAPP